MQYFTTNLDFSHIHFASTSWVFLLPLAMMALDIVTGLVKAWEQENFKSKKMRSGLSKKIGEIAAIVMGELFQYALNLPPYIMACVSMYIVFMELMSNVENLNAIGVPLPAFFTKVLQSADDILKNEEEIKTIIEKIEQLENKASE